MKVAIVGYGVEGLVAARYFHSLGDEVTVCDQNTELEKQDGYHFQLGKGYLNNLGDHDIIVRTAGMNPGVILGEHPELEEKITSTIDYFLTHSPTPNIIGITGTKGKSTTSTLTAKIIEANGMNVFLGGNIGKSPLEFISELQPDDWVVLELSSFQLFDIKHSPHISACLMLAPEHLNWHKDEEEYFDAKANIFRFQNSGDFAVYNPIDKRSTEVSKVSKGSIIPYFKQPGAYLNENKEFEIDGRIICSVDEINILGAHNWQNICAAITLAYQAGARDPKKIASAITNFKGLEHRLSLVHASNGIKFYDDSISTTPEAAIAGIDSFSNPKVLILGGSDKGVSFKALAEHVSKANVRHIVLIGQITPDIKKELEKAGFNAFSKQTENMAEAVSLALKEAEPGDVVLLSPGAASFGMFKGYKDRGDQFTSEVKRQTA